MTGDWKIFREQAALLHREFDMLHRIAEAADRLSSSAITSHPDANLFRERFIELNLLLDNLRRAREAHEDDD